jgi:hypothetical protein
VAGDKYRVEQGDPVRDRTRILDLWKRCEFAPGEDAQARYDWFYLRNPRGHGRVYLLVHADTGELVGAVGAGSRWFARGQTEPPLRGAILVDFVVHPLHRSMFPALQLQRAAREHEFRSADVVYGLPDVKAAPIFKRLDAARQFSSGNYVRVLRSGKYASRLMPKMAAMPVRLACWWIDRARLLLLWALCRASGVRTHWQRELPAGLDALWRRAVSQPDHATGERDQEYLDWRFCRARRDDWWVLALTSVRDERLDAYFICRRDGNDLQVLVFLPADRRRLVTKFLALSLAAWALEVESVRIELGGSAAAQRALVRAGFLLRDERPCFLMQAAGADAPALPQQWWLTRADEDV